MTEPSKERIAAALALAESVDRWATKMGTFIGPLEGRITNDQQEYGALVEGLSAYRATAPKPLRTRAEVDRDIADEVRRLPLPPPLASMSEVVIRGIVAERLLTLRAEPLAPDPTDTGACPPECPECPKPYGPSSVDSALSPSAPAAGATFQQPWECSQHKSSGYGPIGCPLCRAELPSGPHPIPATKESSDTNAGVEVGAAYEPESCGCEQSDDLKERIANALWELEATRWNPKGDIAAWAKTPDGENHRHVMAAIEQLRGKP